MAKVKKTEHAGAKNGGGYWGPRAEAKVLSKKARREDSKKILKEQSPKKPLKKTFKYRNADKQIGLLLKTFTEERFFFRIYGKNGTFKDYDILHDDIRVQILDDSAEFLESEDGEEFYLDYSRKVLGQETKYKRVKAKK
jgi:hypothetical protein